LLFTDLITAFHTTLFKVVVGKDPAFFTQMTDYLATFTKEAKEILMPGQPFY